MKILIGYDGSDCAKMALEDLKSAGLPTRAEALVMSMADVFLPPPIDEDIDEAFPKFVPEGVKRAHEHAERELKKAGELAVAARDRIQQMFPEWEVRHLALADSPAWALLRQADIWKPDLIVVGAQGHAVFGGRLILGSISQRVLYEAFCSVRIARKPHGEKDGLRLLIGVDKSPFSIAAVESVCNREWPNETEVKLVAVVDTVMAVTPDPTQPSVMKWIEVGDEKNWDQVSLLFETEAAKLRAAGLDTKTIIRRGNPTNAILDEAERWNADCIFLGPKGTRGIDLLLLGSVSSAVAARAKCSVEIVRTKSKTLP